MTGSISIAADGDAHGAPPEPSGRHAGVPLWGAGLAVPAFALLALARRFGFVAPVPIWVVLLELVVTLAAMAAITSRYPPGSPRARPVLHSYVQIALIGTIIYTLGWGAALIVGFIFPAIAIISSDGSRFGPRTIYCITATVLVGEIAVALGVFKSLVPEPTGHGLAVLELAGTCAIVWMLTFNQRAKEALEESERDAERRLREAQEVFIHAFDEAGVAMVLINPDGAIRRSNDALADLLGIDRVTELRHRQVSDFVHEEDRAGLDDLLRGLVASGAKSARRDLRFRPVDDVVVWAAMTISMVRSEDGSPHYAVAQIENITERKAVSEQLEFQAAHDPMTGLANRVAFSCELIDTLESCAHPLAVFFIDLDRFKLVNDGLGHAAGDELLVQVAGRLRQVLRPEDRIARFGGDEFVVMCCRIADVDEAYQVADRMLAALSQPLRLDEGEVFVSASIGITLSEPGTTAEQLLQRADAAMYQAKRDGRGRAVSFTVDHFDAVAAELKIGNELHRALEREEFVLHYQPIWDLFGGTVLGVEALLRWDHPEHGVLLPDRFLGQVADTGLMVPVGNWVLEAACRQMAEWQAQGSPVGDDPISVSVNVAVQQIVDPKFVPTVAEAIDRTGISPASLCLELTEASLMSDTATTIQALESLLHLGVQLCIDDFGTGYSSLSYLRRFPVSILKIDRSFVKGLGTDDGDAEIVQTITTLAHSLGMVAVAEGVETSEQFEALRAIGCDLAQGFLLGRPAPADRLEVTDGDGLVAWQDLGDPADLRF
jgi:diguanylate cyclase (GGDEF)-like protein/PAS domain S-box-containing protein